MDKNIIENLKLEVWDVKDIKPYAKNAKIHTKAQVEKLASIIKKEGYRVPIEVDENGVIIRGHGRRLAIIKLGMKKVPVSVIRGLTNDEKDAARISDNMVSRGEFDMSLLGDEVLRLSLVEDFDLSSLSMDDFEISEMFNKYSSADEFNIPENTSSFDNKDAIAKPAAKGLEYQPSYSVIIECTGETHQREIYEKLTADGIDCSIQTMA